MNEGIHRTCTTSTFHTKIICLTLLVLLLTLGSSWARPDKKAGPDLSDMSKGNIDYVHEDDKIVINDMIFFIDKNTKFLAPSGNSVSKNQLNKGDIVYFKSSKEQLLKKVYVTKKAAQKETTSSPVLKPSSQNMFQENGVWKN